MRQLATGPKSDLDKIPGTDSVKALYFCIFSSTDLFFAKISKYFKIQYPNFVISSSIFYTYIMRIKKVINNFVVKRNDYWNVGISWTFGDTAGKSLFNWYYG